MDKLTEQLAEALRYPGRCYCAEKRWNLRDETALCVRCAALAAYDAAKENETRLTETTGRAAGIAHERVQPVTAGETAQQEAAKAGGGDGVLDLLQRRCDAYENTLEDIRDDAGYNKESGLRAADVLRRWSALPPPPEQV